MPNWVHFSPAPIALLNALEDRSSQLRREAAGGKPWGLWFSPGDAWKEYSERRALAGDWCLEDVRDRLRHKTQVIIYPGAKVLRLENAAEMDNFTRDWAVNGGRAIEWVRFAQHWDGIVIAPHCPDRSRQESTLWYKDWDVPSGCIWRPRAIAGLQPLA
jgi:hypothetical protein